MSEPESEDEVLDRIEEALRKIASASARPSAHSTQGKMQDTSLDREALAATLDTVIARLRGALITPPPPETE